MTVAVVNTAYKHSEQFNSICRLLNMIISIRQKKSKQPFE